MIVVIADDITGAAEIGGIALRYGFDVLLSDELDDAGNHEVIVIYTNTRSMTESEAAQIMGKLTSKSMQLKPSLFYKKTDSVLRGHVLAEMKSQMSAMNLERGLLVPVNPSSGRIIRDGNYYINNRLVHETSFSIDPEFPISSSRLQEMLGVNEVNLSIKKRNENLALKGITVGEAEINQDLEAWANQNDGSLLLAGGGSFFNALLQVTYKQQRKEKKVPVKFSMLLCLVSGTTFSKYEDLVSYMPAEIFSATSVNTILYDQWLDQALRILKKNNRVIIAIDNSEIKRVDPQLLGEKLAELVSRLIAASNIADLLIEGGATAYSIVRKIGWHSFVPTEELDQGIVRMQVADKPGLHLIIKPGSYDWPSEWNFN